MIILFVYTFKCYNKCIYGHYGIIHYFVAYPEKRELVKMMNMTLAYNTILGSLIISTLSASGESEVQPGRREAIKMF